MLKSKDTVYLVEVVCESPLLAYSNQILMTRVPCFSATKEIMMHFVQQWRMGIEQIKDNQIMKDIHSKALGELTFLLNDAIVTGKLKRTYKYKSITYKVTAQNVMGYMRNAR